MLCNIQLEVGCLPIQVMVLGGHSLFREALAGSLTSYPDLQIVGCSSCQFDEALTLIYTTRVDVVLMCLNPGDKWAIDFTTRARNQGFRGGLLVVTTGTSDTETLHALERCHAGIFLQTQPIRLLHQRIRAEAAARWVTAESGSSTAHAMKSEVGKTTITSREAAVLMCIVEGLSNKAIGDHLGISENTVKTFVQHLFQKTGAQSRSRLVRNTIEHWAEQAQNNSRAANASSEQPLGPRNRRRDDPINLMKSRSTLLPCNSNC